MLEGHQHLQEIKSWRVVSDASATAGQPTEAQLALVARAGYTVIINLGLAGTGYALPDERASIQALGLAYEHIPVLWESPTLDDWRVFRVAMRRWSDEKVLVHCAANMRASVFVALYGLLDLGWSQAQADALIASVWQPNDTWRAFIDSVLSANRSKH